MTTKPAFPALDAPTVTGFGARVPRVEELILPESVESGNLSLNKAVIRWMSDKTSGGVGIGREIAPQGVIIACEFASTVRLVQRGAKDQDWDAKDPFARYRKVGIKWKLGSQTL